jgi:hypothetical protein
MIFHPCNEIHQATGRPPDHPSDDDDGNNNDDDDNDDNSGNDAMMMIIMIVIKSVRPLVCPLTVHLMYNNGNNEYNKKGIGRITDKINKLKTDLCT